MSSTNVQFPTKVKNHMFNSIINYAGVNQPLTVVLLKSLTFDEINNLPSYDWYGPIGVTPDPSLNYRNNIKTIEVPAGGNYVPNTKSLPGTPVVTSDDTITVFKTDSNDMKITWASLNCTIYGYAIIGTVGVSTPQGPIFPVIAYEYLNSSIVLKDSDFELSWAQTKINNTIQNFLYKWSE